MPIRFLADRLSRAILMLLLYLATNTHADLISPLEILENTAGVYHPGLTDQNLINQSGLAQEFTNGATDLATFFEGDTTALSPSSTFTGWFADLPTGSISFDLGATYILSDLLLWNDTDYQGIGEFTLDIASNAAFVGAVSSGIFTPTTGDVDGGNDYTKPIPLQVFNLGTAVTGRYVRVNMASRGGEGPSNLNVGEIAFNEIGSVPVPIPTTLALFSLGLTTLFWLRSIPRR